MTKLLAGARRHSALAAELAALAAVLVGIAAIYSPAAWIVGGASVIFAIERHPEAPQSSQGSQDKR